MVENKKKKSKKSRQDNNPTGFVRGLTKLQSKLRAILYMPNDFNSLYEKPLQERIKNTGFTLMFAEPEKLPDKFGSYDRILAYQCPLPKLVADNETGEAKKDIETSTNLKLFEVVGAPSDGLMTPFPRRPGCLTDIEYRYLQLRDTITQQERNDHFRKLAQIQQNIRFKLLVLQDKQAEADSLVKQIQKVDKGYHMVLAYYLQQAIDNVLQLVTLGDVMKKYIKVLIIDDMGNRTVEQLEQRGFRRRFITTMSQKAFSQTFDEFKDLYQKHFPEATVTQQDFFSKCTVFDEYEIVAFNQWHSEKGSLPVLFRLKKNPELSQKEMRKLGEKPEKVAAKVSKLQREQQSLDDQLKNVEIEMHTAEAKGGLSESAYVSLNKKRKRMLRQIKNLTDELNEIQQEVDVRPELTLYTRDFLAALLDKKLVKTLLSQKGAKGTDRSVFNPDSLTKLAELNREKRKKERSVRQMNRQVKILHKKMNDYAARHPIDPNKPIQQVLGVHTLNKLEMTVLGCSIAKINHLLHIYPGPYFKIRNRQDTVNWDSSLITEVSVHIASKHFKLNTLQLKKFFRVASSDMAGRLENSPALPRSSDFNNDKYGLFVINFNSFPISEIINCLKTRNRSKRPYVPVLIVDPLNKIDSSSEKIKLELLLGLKRDGAKNLAIQPPPYQIESLDNGDELKLALCKVMGINFTSLSSIDAKDEFSMALEDSDFLDQSSRMDLPEDHELPELPSESAERRPVADEQKACGHGLKPPSTSKPAIASRRKDDRIKLYIRSEKKEEIYTLGSLFSFDDDAGTPPPKPEAPQDHTVLTSSGSTHASDEMVPDDEMSALEAQNIAERAHEPLPPVKQEMNPKNPFQF